MVTIGRMGSAKFGKIGMVVGILVIAGSVFGGVALASERGRASDPQPTVPLNSAVTGEDEDLADDPDSENESGADAISDDDSSSVDSICPDDAARGEGDSEAAEDHGSGAGSDAGSDDDDDLGADDAGCDDDHDDDHDD